LHKEKAQTGGVAQEVECLLGKLKDLTLNFSSTKKKNVYKDKAQLKLFNLLDKLNQSSSTDPSEM
jgi:hypothetical protein